MPDAPAAPPPTSFDIAANDRCAAPTGSGPAELRSVDMAALALVRRLEDSGATRLLEFAAGTSPAKGFEKALMAEGCA